VEPRHESWWTDEVKGVLEARGAALCWADRLDRPVSPLWRTAGWGYVRLHQAADGWEYGEPVLSAWAARMREAGWDEAYVYFNNDPGGAAVRNARRFTALA
jgi:uncharacterized protein YecE (DUF72 family)